VSGRIRVRRVGDSWWVELPRFGFAPSAPLRFASHAEALAYAATEADRRRKPVSLYAGVTAESWAPWTLRRSRL
jgi:hypothetical protein